jgi:hypothetical protein
MKNSSTKMIKMINSNFFKCDKCGRSLIAEELEIHECKKVIDYRIEGNILWLSDGENWYPRKLLSRSPTQNEQQNRTTEGETEPKVLKQYENIYTIYSDI